MPHGSPKSVSAPSDAPFLRTLGAHVAELDERHARLELPYRDENANRNGSLHGGVVAALIDVAAATLALHGVDPRRHERASSIDFTVSYLAPAVREDVTAVATLLRRGRDITFVEVDVATAAGKRIARGLVAHRAGPVPGRPPAGRPDAPGSDAAARTRAVEDLAPEQLRAARPSGSPFTARIGVTSVRLGRGRAVSLLPLQDDVLADDGTVHEGALAALVDCAGGAAAWSIDGFNPHGRAATVGMHLCFDVSTRGEDVLAEAKTSWASDGTYVSAVTVAGRSSGRAIASGTVTYRIAMRPRRA
ncbi:MAG TPA: hotdog fold thioesterase [Candidatus Binatia bacterium]